MSSLQEDAERFNEAVAELGRVILAALEPVLAPVARFLNSITRRFE